MKTKLILSTISILFLSSTSMLMAMEEEKKGLGAPVVQVSSKAEGATDEQKPKSGFSYLRPWTWWGSSDSAPKTTAAPTAPIAVVEDLKSGMAPKGRTVTNFTVTEDAQGKLTFVSTSAAGNLWLHPAPFDSSASPTKPHLASPWEVTPGKKFMVTFNVESLKGRLILSLVGIGQNQLMTKPINMGLNEMLYIVPQGTTKLNPVISGYDNPGFDISNIRVQELDS